MWATLPVIFSKRPGGVGTGSAPVSGPAGGSAGERPEAPSGPENE
jgi:hypothetical protein